MFWDTKKFKREQRALRLLKDESDLSPLVEEQIFRRVMQAVLAGPEASAQKAGTRVHWSKISFSVALASVLLAVLSGTALAASGANPGDALYPVKIAQEKVRLSLASSGESKAKLHKSFAEERVKELKKISTKPAPASAAFNAASQPPKGLIENEKVKKSAAKSIKNTMKDLEKTELQLEKQGKLEAAKELRLDFLKLKKEAKEKKLLVEEDGENESRSED